LSSIPKAGMTKVASAVDALLVFLGQRPGRADTCFFWGRSFS
jgi:hypothetical protein